MPLTGLCFILRDKLKFTVVICKIKRAGQGVAAWLAFLLNNSQSHLELQAAVVLRVFLYSLLSATTGSFLAATLAGISPAINVSSMLIRTSAAAPTGGSADTPEISEKCSIIRFMGILSSMVTRIPIMPATNPTISVSALKTREISRFEAPIERSIPISLVRSSTEI